MEQSESIKELAAALAKAQAEMKAAEMNATNPFLKNKYSDLGEVIKASRPALTSNGLSVVQPVSFAEGMVIITTQLMHASGEFIREVMAFPVAEAKGKSAVQEAGSVITYLRRYSLSSMLGIYADDDTDGENKSQERKPETSRKPDEKQPDNGNGNGNGNGKQQPAKMDIETARAVTNSEGVKYGDLSRDTLSNMTIGIDKALKKPGLTQAEKDAYQYKLDAIRTILAVQVA